MTRRDTIINKIMGLGNRMLNSAIHMHFMGDL